MTIRIKLYFFASIKEIVGERQVDLELPDDTTVGDLKSHLFGTYSHLIEYRDSILTSVNHEFATDKDIIPDGAEIAFFPPVSGGLEELPTICWITADEIDINNIISQIVLPTTGAACFFIGMVREVTKRYPQHQTIHLEYETYYSMALDKIKQITREIRANWQEIEGIAIVQRVGTLDPGTPTVIVACSAAHRDSGIFDAARYGIDRLKEIVPIWKKEVGPDQEIWVEGEYIPKREE